LKAKTFHPLKPIYIMVFFFSFMLFLCIMQGINWINTRERTHLALIIVALVFTITILCMFFIPFFTDRTFRFKATEKSIDATFYCWDPIYSSSSRKIVKYSILFSEIDQISKETAQFTLERMPYRPVIILHLFSGEIVYCELVGYTKNQLISIWNLCNKKSRTIYNRPSRKLY